MLRFLLALLTGSTVLVACGEVRSTHDGDDPGMPDASIDGAMPDMPGSGAFELVLGTPNLPVVAGASVFVDVTISRHAPFTDAVTLTVTGLPAGVSAAPTTIGAGETSAQVEIVAAATAPQTAPTQIAITGTAGALQATTTLALTVAGPPGSLDQTFVGGGKQLLAMGPGDDYAYAVAIQPDGKILVAGTAGAVHGGDFAIVRLDRDGTLDTTFGDGGKVLTDFAGGNDSIYALALQPDGKIVAAGTAVVQGTSWDFAVARYNADGTLDTTFSGDGKQTTAVGTSYDMAYAVLVQPGGKIVLGGEVGRSTYPVFDTDFALVRYNADGSLDQTFNGTGIVTTAVRAAGRDAINALAQPPDDSEAIIAVGGDDDFLLARYLTNDQLDPAFGTEGLVTSVFQSGVGAARAVAIAPSGELFVAGHSNHHFAVAELSSAGAVSPPLNKAIVQLGEGNDEAEAIALDGDHLIVAGWAHEGTSQAGNFALVRLLPDGTLDTSFGGGRVITPMGASGANDQAMAMALQADNSIPTVRAVVAGYATDTNLDFAVARFWR